MSAAGVRWAIVGTGWMCSGVARAIRAHGAGTIVGVVSRDRDRGRAFASTHDVTDAFDDLEACLARTRPDAVYVGSPNAQHPVDTLAALDHGAHVLCDKPMALTVADALAMRDRAAAAGRLLGVNLQTRFHPTMVAARAAIDAGRIGSVVSVQVRLGFGVELLEGWRADPALAGGGSIHNLGAHAIDALVFLAGAEAASVSAQLRPHGATLDRTAQLGIRFRNDVLGIAAVSQETFADDVRIEVRGTEGRMAWDGWLAPYRSGELVITTESGSERQPAEAPDAYERLVAAFEEAVVTALPFRPGPADGLALVSIVDAAVRSSSSGAAVAL